MIIYRVSGNGNCLFNACLIALIGDERIPIYLRCLTSIEMFSHSSYYADHSIIFGHSWHGKPTNENTIFSNTLSQITYQSFQNNDRVPAVTAESVKVAKNHTYSSLLSVLALSSVIGRQIESYYLVQCDTSPDIYETVFNCTVISLVFQKYWKILLPSMTVAFIYFAVLLCQWITFQPLARLPSTKDHFVIQCLSLRWLL